jgi:hypothetical protein
MFLYAITILVSAFLLFQVQPVIAKIILPWFGGSAAVWTTCLLFFQLALLLGYLYSHAVVRYLKPRMQMALHACLLLASAAALPIYPSSRWKPVNPNAPILHILALLALTVGLPYFLLSTSGPLLQAWYARRFQGAIPYRLYALSNAGSMFALLSYPVVIEPNLTSRQQAGAWSIAYCAFALLCGFAAFRSGHGPAADPAEEQDAGEKPGLRLYLMWLLLPACASALLLAVTNHLSQNVAAIPFLWVLPLSVYLFSFILCFESSGWYRRSPYLQLLAVALGSMAYSMFADYTGNVPIKISVPLFLMGLFTCCMACHGELARLKPHPRYLTHFYLMIAAGGALGGAFVGLAAPLWFNGFYEMPIALVACGALAVAVLRTYPEPAWLGDLLPAPQFLCGVVTLLVGGCAAYALRSALVDPAHAVASWIRKTWQPTDGFDQAVLMCALALGAALALAILRGDPKLRWIRRWAGWSAFGVELLALILAGYVGYEMREAATGYRMMARNFYGCLKVRDSGLPSELGATRTLTNGTINHGEQFLNPARRDSPTTYYGPDTGVGIAIRDRQSAGRAIRVGVIGLGAGTLAAYGRLGDYYRFYEINPLVLRMSVPPEGKDPQFTFLADCKARHDVAMGDARLSLEREAPENFDVLAVDAFSSDSIPVHLLTKEAMQLFFRHLSRDGILAVHISNRYLDLEPVVGSESRALGKAARTVDTDDDESRDVFSATWVLVTSPGPGFGDLVVNASKPIEMARRTRLWTDDYSNLFQILK